MLLTDTIYQSLFRAILEGEFQPGGRFLTEREAMERFQVSRITARRAFARLEADRVISRKTKVGTTVNSGFGATGGIFNMIGAVVPMSDFFARSFLQKLWHEGAARDVVTVLEPAENGGAQNEALIRLILHGVRDIVIWGIDRELDMRLCLRLRVLGINLVFFDRIDPGNIADYVTLDNEGAEKMLIAAAARKKIRHVFWADDTGISADSNRERKKYCQAECRKNGLVFSEQLPENGFPSGSAIFAVNDPTAIHRTGCGVPVFSIDGLPEARNKGIISCPQPMGKLAECCFQALSRQRQLGEKWQARKYRIPAGEPVS